MTTTTFDVAMAVKNPATFRRRRLGGNPVAGRNREATIMNQLDMTTLNPDLLREYAAELDALPVRVATGERAQVEAVVRHHADLLADVLDGFRQHSALVFRAVLPPSPPLSEAWRELLAVWLAKAKPMAALGRQFEWRWVTRNRLPSLEDLHYLLAEVDFLLLHWSPPQRSVTPSPRTEIPEAVLAKMKARFGEMTAGREPTSEVAVREPLGRPAPVSEALV